MALFDMPLEELERYRPEVQCPADLADFWRGQLAAARATADAPVVTRVETSLSAVTVDDVTFPGYGGHPIKAWLLRPASHQPGIDEPLTTVVEFLGYGGGRGLPVDHLWWAASGMAHLVMDTRGQGAHWGSGGSTPDPVGRSAGVAGFVTAGIDDPADHFYTRFYVDAARAVDAVRGIEGIDHARVGVKGGSQGGAGAVGATALLSLAGQQPLVSMPDVPFLTNFRRAISIVDSHPYAEITKYLSILRDPAKETTLWNTLSYLDGTNLAALATSPALFSVGLMDLTCPPSTVYSEFNNWGNPDKRMDIYTYNDHEGGQSYRYQPQLEWLKGH